MNITIKGRVYKIVIMPKVVKDLKKGKITLGSLQNTLEKNSDFLENIFEDTFFLEDAQYNTMISGYKGNEIIEIQFAVLRQHIATITLKDKLIREMPSPVD